MENTNKEDIITIHLGRIVSDELYDQIVKDIVKLLKGNIQVMLIGI